MDIWQHCSSPQQWQKEPDVLHLSLQTLSQWLWGGERVKGRRGKKGREREVGRGRVLIKRWRKRKEEGEEGKEEGEEEEEKKRRRRNGRERNNLNY